MSTNPEPGGTLALEVQALAVRYGRTAVLEDVSLAVPRGTVAAVLGRNGSGKTSLLRCVLGHRPPSGGRIDLLGEDPWRSRTTVMERVGVVPEEPNAPPEMTVHQLSAFCARLHKQWDAEAVLGRTRRFDVPLDRPFGSLSKGQRGVVMLALALGHTPEVLLLDDPTLGLDVVARDSVFREVIGDLADRGTSVVVTTHDLRAIEGIAERVAILHGGRVVLEGEMERVKSEWARPLEEIFTAVTVDGARAPSPQEVRA